MVGEIVLFFLWAATTWAFNRFARRIQDEVAILQRENLTMAKAIVSHGKRIDESEADAKNAIEIALDCRKGLTSQPEKPKIVAKTKSVNWKSFRTAIERANDPQEPA
jgi:hypothetical protein